MVKKLWKKLLAESRLLLIEHKYSPSLLLIFVYFYAYFKLGYVKVDCPAGLGPPALGARKRLG